MSFKDCKIKQEYRTLADNIIQDFYLPVLHEATIYKRAVGYFSSTALIEVSKGISELVKHGGHIQLVASPFLSKDDVEAIDKGYRLRDEVIEDALLRELSDDHGDYFSQKRLNLLANLIQTGVLDIKIVFTETANGIGMFHEKLGILTDADGNSIAFSGSMNETATALSFNYEAIDVFCDWLNADDAARVHSKAVAFESIWNGQEKGLSSHSFTNVKDKIIEKYLREEPDYTIDTQQFKKGGRGSVPPHDDSGPLLPQIPPTIHLHQYQEEAISEWVAENYRGIFDMATGTGKTFTGLGAICKITSDLAGYLAVIIVCPYQHLVEQWVEDIVRFNISPIIGYSASPQKDWKSLLKKAIRDQKTRKDKPFFCFVCTNDTFASDFVQAALTSIKAPILLVVDEAHNFGAYRLSSLLDDKYTYRLALSATLERHRDPEGTEALYSFFGRKCIEYDLERAIREEKLTPYYYYPCPVYLSDDELTDYESISYEMSRHLTKGRDGKAKLDSYGEMLAIKRSRVVAAAIMKLDMLREKIRKYQNDHFILVYCGATTIGCTDSDEKGIRQIEAVTAILGKELDMDVARFTSAESIEERSEIKKHFQDGKELQAIVAIKCLDEGVNIPGIKTAFILASTTNPKEYIQRRGRVLRKSPETGKKYAEIYDFVTLPRELPSVSGLTEEQMKRDLSLVKNELARIQEFGRLALNQMEAQELIWDIKEAYHITDDNYEEGDYTDVNV